MDNILPVMATTSEKVLQLRQMLAERFSAPDLKEKKTFVTGFEALDALGIPHSAITEIVSLPSAGPGGALLLYGLLQAVLGVGERVVLIDGTDSFEPKGLPPERLMRLLWTRCQNAGEALKASDLVVTIMAYVELHARSAFSFLRGASLPEQLAEVAAKQGLSAMAVCDRNGVHGAPRFYGKGNEHKIRPLVGSELTLEGGAVLPVLVASRTGYQNLCRMLTRAQLRSPKGQGQILWDELEEFHEGLIALTGDAEGPLYDAVSKGDRQEANTGMEKIIRAFGASNVYVEIQRHRTRDEERINNGLIELAGAHAIPLVATNGVLFAEAGGRGVLDVFTCIRHHTHLDAAGLALSINSQRYIKTPRQMTQLFTDLTLFTYRRVLL